jgi:hypothetical protein
LVPLSQFNRVESQFDEDLTATIVQLKVKIGPKYFIAVRVAYSHHFHADPDLDQDPAFHFNVDPDPDISPH